MSQASIAGTGASDIVRSSQDTVLRFALDATLAALADAGLSPDDVDGLITCSTSPSLAAIRDDGVDDFSLLTAQDSLGLRKLRFAIDTQLMAGSMLAAAVQAVKSGQCECVLLIRGLYHDARHAYASVPSNLVGGTYQYTVPYGLPRGYNRAFWLQRYMHDYGVMRSDLYEIISAARKHASLNPQAYWRDKTLSLDEYLEGRWICEPFSVYDCDIPVCGAMALVVVSDSVARALKKPTAHVIGHCMQDGLTGLLESLGLHRRDLGTVQLYDGYSSFVPYWLEKLGFCDEGSAFELIRDGGISIGGALPVNTFGGSLGEGRMHGMGHIKEGALQAMGKAGKRQVHGTTGLGLVQVGVPENSWIFLLGQEPRRSKAY